MCLLCKSYVKKKKDSKSDYLLSIQSIRICFCITLFVHFFFFFFSKSCNHILEWNSSHLVSRSATCSTANEVLMSWVYLLQVNVSCNWGAEKQQSHNNERREDPVQNLLEFGSRHGPKRRVYIRDLEVWLKMPNESDYWCDYWQIHESDLFTSGKDSIPLFCLLFNHIMTFSFFIWEQPLLVAKPC